MKKVLIFIICLLFLTGCGKNKYIKCNIDLSNAVDNYKLTGEYKIYYKKNYVSKIEKTEIYSSESKEVLKYFKDSITLKNNYNNDVYGGYTVTLKGKENSLETNIIINLEKSDIKKMLKDELIDKEYVIDNKITVSGLKKVYEAKGYKCE